MMNVKVPLWRAHLGVPTAPSAPLPARPGPAPRSPRSRSLRPTWRAATPSRAISSAPAQHGPARWLPRHSAALGGHVTRWPHDPSPWRIRKHRHYGVGHCAGLPILGLQLQVRASISRPYQHRSAARRGLRNRRRWSSRLLPPLVVGQPRSAAKAVAKSSIIPTMPHCTTPRPCTNCWPG